MMRYLFSYNYPTQYFGWKYMTEIPFGKTLIQATILTVQQEIAANSRIFAKRLQQVGKRYCPSWKVVNLKARTMKRTLFLLICFLTVNLIIAQDRKFRLSANVSLSIPTYTEISSMAIGLGANGEFAINRKWATLITADFHHFFGTVINHFNQDTIKGFSILPVMAGLKIYPNEKFYLGAQAGVSVGLQHAGNCPAIGAFTGILVPLKGGNKVDIGLKFTGIMRQTSFPENTFLNRGGYSFLSGRIGYFF